MEFLKTQERMIVTESGKEVLLQGFGEFVRAEKMDRGRSINQTIIELCGPDYADHFWKQWHRNYFGKADIEDMAKRGFNSVRLPLNAKVFLKEGPGLR